MDCETSKNGDCLLLTFVDSGPDCYFYEYHFKLSDTGLGGSTLSTTQLDLSTALAFPYYPFKVIASEVDNDNAIEWVFNYYAQITGADYTYIRTLNMTNSTNFGIKKSNSWRGVTGATNLILGSYNPNSPQTLAMAYKLSPNSKIRLNSYYWANANGWNVYQNRTSSQGVNVLSNVFQMHLGQGNYGYCALGYNATKLDLFCGYDWGGLGWFQSSTIEEDTSGFTPNYVPQSTTNEILVHSFFANQQFSSTSPINDLLTPFGVFKLGTPNYFTGSGTLSQSYAFPSNYSNAQVYPVSTKATTYFDLGIMTLTNFIYLSDSYIKPNPSLSCTVTPCTSNGAWLINTSVNIICTVNSDRNQYNVRARAYFYYGDSNQELSNWSSFITSGSTFNFNFIANKTISNGIIKVEAQDSTEDVTVNATRTFSVSNSGIVTGGCTDSFDSVPINTSQNTSAPYYQNATIQDNSLKRAFYQQAREANMPAIAFFVLIILGIDLVIFFEGVMDKKRQHHEVSQVLLFILLIDIIAFIVGAWLGIISSSVIITIILILVIVGILFFISWYNKKQQGV